MSKWIPVTERLPDCIGTYEVRYNVRRINPNAPDRETRAMWTGWWHLGAVLEVTEWKPIPNEA